MNFSQPTDSNAHNQHIEQGMIVFLQNTQFSHHKQILIARWRQQLEANIDESRLIIT